MLKAIAQEASSDRPTTTKTKIVEAALKALRTEGFAGASARTIARKGGFNQALVFYHFGSVPNLLLAALDETSRQRMAAYRTTLDEANTPQDLVNVALRVYREDLASGHITVLAEMIAGSLSNPKLNAEILSRIEPWIDFAEAAIRKLLSDSPLGGALRTRDLAHGVVALYLGVEMLTHLEQDQERVEALFSTAQSLATAIAPLLGAAAE